MKRNEESPTRRKFGDLTGKGSTNHRNGLQLYYTMFPEGLQAGKENHMNRGLIAEDEVRAKAAAQEQLRRCKHSCIPDIKTLAKIRYFVRLCKKWVNDPALEAAMLYELGRMDGIRQERQRRAKRGGGDQCKH